MDLDRDMISSGGVQTGPDQPGSKRAGSLESCLVSLEDKSGTMRQ
jgi:hypothetical protein